jgi:peptide/nickel transport system permease protein
MQQVDRGLVDAQLAVAPGAPGGPPSLDGAPASVAPRSQRVVLSVVRDLFRYSAAFRVGALVLLLLLVLAALSAHAPYAADARRVVPQDRPPSPEYPLGTTTLGQDVFWLTTYAIRNSLFIATLAVIISRSIAVLLGSFSGYVGGPVDRVLGAITDSFIVIPRLPLLILISFMVRGSLNMVGLAVLIGLLDWAWPSKRYRAQVLSLREEEFTNTATFSGLGTLEVILHEHVPFLIPFLMADAVSGFLFAIGVEITLAILGLSDLGMPTIGTMIYWANYYQVLLTKRLWWIVTPLVGSVLLVVALYLLSTSLGTYLDPRTRLKNLGLRRAAA